MIYLFVLRALNIVPTEVDVTDLQPFASISDSHADDHNSNYHQPIRDENISDPDVAKLYEEFLHAEQNKHDPHDIKEVETLNPADGSTNVPSLLPLIKTGIHHVASAKIHVGPSDGVSSHTQLSYTLESSSHTAPVNFIPPLNRTAIPLRLLNRLEAFSNHKPSNITNLVPQDREEFVSIRPVAERKHSAAKHMKSRISEIQRQLDPIPDNGHLNSSIGQPHSYVEIRMVKAQNGEFDVQSSPYSTSTSVTFKKTASQAILSKLQSCKKLTISRKCLEPISDSINMPNKVKNHKAQELRGVDSESSPQPPGWDESINYNLQNSSTSQLLLSASATHRSCIQQMSAKEVPGNTLPNSNSLQSITERVCDNLQVSTNYHVAIASKPSRVSKRQNDSLMTGQCLACSPTNLKAIPSTYGGGVNKMLRGLALIIHPLTSRTEQAGVKEASRFHSSTHTTASFNHRANTTPTLPLLSNCNKTAMNSKFMSNLHSPSRMHPVVKMLLEKQHKQKALYSGVFSWKDVFILRDNSL